MTRLTRNTANVTWPILGIVFLLLPRSAIAERTIQGRVLEADGQPAVGYHVRAFDSDPNADDLMGEALTDQEGRYKIVYRPGSWDGEKTSHHTQWRPDIYVAVARPKPGGGWTRVDQSGVHKDHEVSKDITQNFSIPKSGECPYPAKFDTTGVWNNCQCPAGTYKRWLDWVKKGARCADGESPQMQCERKGDHWEGIDHNHGQCVPKVVAQPHEYVLREAYYKYFQHVSDGVELEPLPSWVIQRWGNGYQHVDLAEIRIGESGNTPTKNTAVTDCKKIYFPKGSEMLSHLHAQKNVDDCWLLHEMAHADQCMNLTPRVDATKRDAYAEMWFSQLQFATVLAILDGEWPTSSEIHDRMPMERWADQTAERILGQICHSASAQPQPAPRPTPPVVVSPSGRREVK